MDTQLIRFTNVKYAYEVPETPEGLPPAEPTNWVLDGVSLRINAGEYVAILGHNGSGKSTLAKLSNAILLPMGGSVMVDGLFTEDEENLLKVRQTVGMVFQNPDNQIVATVIEEDVAFALENLGVEPLEIRQRVDEALQAVGMYEYRMHAPHRLSGGQKQRVAIAGIIAMRPKCIVLDEPTAMLDPQGRREVLSTIRTLCKERNIAVVLITHHMNEAAEADRVIVMDHGEILLDNAPREVFRETDILLRVGLTVPQPEALLYELRLAGERIPQTALTVEECCDILFAWLQTAKERES